MHARMTKVRGVNDVDGAIQTIRETVSPGAREMGGYKGLLAFVDREADVLMTFTLWESEEAMRGSEEAANALRDETTREIGAGETSVKHFEVAVVDLPAAVAV